MLASYSSPGLGDSADHRDIYFVFVAAVFGSILSIFATDFLFPFNNDVGYLAVVAKLYEEPQFANSAYFQSYRFFPSGFWMTLQGLSPYLNMYWTFLVLFFISRFLTFIGFLSCARLFGVRSLRSYLLFSSVIASSFLLRGVSLAGGNGLFIEYFSHSELDNGLLLLSVSELIRRRIVVSIILLGIIGFINAFFAVWVLFPLTTILLIQLIRKDILAQKIFRELILGGVIAVLICAPVLVSIARNEHNSTMVNFDYVSYLREYYPFHMLSDSNSLRQKIGLAIVAASSITGFVLLGRFRDYFIAATISVIVVYCLGVMTPHLTHTIVVLNLHLLRSGGLLHLLCALATATLATQWWFDQEKVNSSIKGPVLVTILTILTTPPVHLLPALMALFAFLVAAFARPALWFSADNQRGLPEPIGSAMRAGAVLWVTASLLIQTVMTYRSHAFYRQWIAEWEAVANWARSNTKADAMFLIPVEPTKQNFVFEFEARRAAWVDWKRGDVVMWNPSYYKEWHQRMMETENLASIDDKVAYAKTKHIQYVIDVCGDDGQRSDLAFRRWQLCVYDVSVDGAR